MSISLQSKMHELIFALVTCVICMSNCASNQNKRVPGYCWRDYHGVIPKDAVQGGTDRAGKPTYVGQAYFEKYELLPAIIFEGSAFANATAYQYEISTDKNVKILCAKNKRAMQWIAVDNEGTQLLTGNHLVNGGSEIGLDIYIGRVQHDGKIVTGKVFLAPASNSGLWIPYNNAPIRFTSYEILTYNPTLSTDHIDVRVNH